MGYDLLESAIFHDGTSEFRDPMVPKAGESVKITLRTAKDVVRSTVLIANGKEIPMKKLTKVSERNKTNRFDYFEEKFIAIDGINDYYFKLECDEFTAFYDVLGLSTGHDSNYNFKVTSGYDTPDWAKGVVMYQIFVDRFYNGDPSNDVVDDEYAYVGEHVSHANWEDGIADVDIRRFYGGDLQGVIDKLDYLQKLGIEALYLNPIFVSPSNHKYDIQDYDHIDPHFGVIVNDVDDVLSEYDNDNTHAKKYIKRVTDKENLEASNKLFARLVEEAHSRNIRVIIDGVFNHCGSFNKWIDREMIYKDAEGFEPGAYVSKDSPYRNFFKFADNTDYCRNYEGWWGYDTLPKLNFEDSKELYDYILRIGSKWVSAPYNVDGWRLDVAADLGHSKEMNHQFWTDFRKSVKSANKNAIILAEHYGDPSDWLQGGQWDSIMNYDAFMEPVSWFLTGVDKHSDNVDMFLKGNGKSFAEAMKHNMAKMQTQSLLVSMNQLSNHDHSRFLTRTNGRCGRIVSDGMKGAEEGVNIALMKAAIIMQMTWPGAPTFYYGDEAGLCGWTDPDNRRPYPWGKENAELIDFCRYAIYFHSHNKALKTGAFKMLIAMNNVVSFGRFEEDSKIITLVSTAHSDMEVDIPVWQLDISDDDTMERLLYSYEDKYNVGKVDYNVEGGSLHVKITPESAMMFRVKKNRV